ncbi:MAG: acyl-CoA dehydrogenase family protein [Acidobacteria bacterium]|nr:acyl-CoA dehydrogenase family protein [Acidobacteriota bacterium]MDW7984095.1 acyl-CoA dehydrogenase family protein [Acidobacteriota bacterium]
MEFAYTEEYHLLRDTVRAFMESEVAPHVDRWDRAGYFPDEVFRRLGEMGLLGASVSEEYGGTPLDALGQAIAVEEMARISASVAITVGVHVGLVCPMIVRYGTPEARARYLPAMARGDWLGAFAQTEPNTGSDAAGIQTRAVRKGDRYVLNGIKVWVTNAEKARVLVVQAVTDPAAGKRGISSFVVETTWPGVTVGRNEAKLGLHSSVTNPVYLEDCEVPVENRLGAEGQGLRIALEHLSASRISVAAQAVGIAQGAYEQALRYTTQRKTFGAFLVEHQAIQFMLADMVTSIEAARLLTHRAAWFRDRGRPFTAAASMAKLFASEMCQRVTYQALQIFGGYGYSREYPLERHFRDARVTTLYEGTSEIQRIIIARELLRAAG